MAANAGALLLLGIDGLPPATLRRFVAEGGLPNFERLLEESAQLDLVPTLPPMTAPGWLTIASGAHPSTIGVESILLPRPGEAPDAIANGFDARHSRAEYLWETLERCGRRAIVLKYPGSWPPRGSGAVQVDGAGGYADISCRFEEVASRAYVTSAPADPGGRPFAFPDGYRDHWRIDTGAGTGIVPVVAREPAGWRGLSPGAEPAFEVVVATARRGRRARRVLHALALREDGRARLVLSADKHAGAGALRLEPGEWSGWLVDDEQPACAHRLKLLELDLERRRLHLYGSEGHRLDGFTEPPELARELVAAAGPVVEWAGTYDLMNGLVDLDTQLEIYAQHTDWLAAALRHLARREAWDGLFTQWHPIEYAHHLVGASLHPEHPLHRPERAERDLDFLRATYALADHLVGEAEEALGGRGTLVVCGDHGHDLVHSVFFANRFLRNRGWLHVEERDGAVAIDWSRTAAYALFPGAVFLNVAGRWPGGVVEPGRVPAIVREIAAALVSMIDPRTGARPVDAVLARAQLAAFGVSGERAPDLAFCLARGYEAATRVDARDTAELELSEPYREATSGHGSFFPHSPSARTLALLRGPAIVPGARPDPVPLVDLAPTMAALLGVPAPRDCEGRAQPLAAEAVA